MTKLLIAVSLAILSTQAHAALQVRSCAPGTETPAAPAAPAKTIYAYVSNSSVGANPYCKLLSGMSPTAYVSTTLDGGATYTWGKISVALAPVVTPPPPPPVAARAQVVWAAPLKDAAGLPLTLPITSYNVYRGTSATTLAKFASGVTSPYVDTTPILGKFYCYAITSVNANGESPVLTAVCVTVAMSNPPGSPTGVTVTILPKLP